MPCTFEVVYKYIFNIYKYTKFLTNTFVNVLQIQLKFLTNAFEKEISGEVEKG